MPPPAPEDPAHWIERALRDYPQRLFLRTPHGSSLSYADLAQASAHYAAALGALGVGAGERVLVRSARSPELIILYVACLRLGALFVPVNPQGTAAELEHVLRDAQPALAVLAPGEHAALAPLAAACGARTATLGAGNEGTLPGSARAPGPRTVTARAHAPGDLAAIVYTSGTTGRPKGAMLTRGNLASNAAVLARAWRFTGEDLLLHVLPLYHVHGLFVALNTTLAAGSGLLFCERFAAPAALAQLAQASVFMGVPTHYTRLLAEPALDVRACQGMRLFVSGSAPLTAATHEAFQARTGHSILERYGMTETLMNTANPYDGPRVPGSVGCALPGIRLRLADRGADGVGVIEVQGPNVCAGYWGAAGGRAADFGPGGWFRTGDLASIDAHGYVTLVGRTRDLIISGGLNVYPKEVELELDALDGISESAVFGVAHPDFGEGVTAVVVSAPGAKLSEPQILAALRTRLSDYKLPKRVLAIDELPRNAMGKVRKEALRERYAQLYARGGDDERAL